MKKIRWGLVNISLESLNLERPISENAKFRDLIVSTIFHYPQEEGVARWALGGGGVACIGGLEKGAPFPLPYYKSMVDWLKDVRIYEDAAGNRNMN